MENKLNVEVVATTSAYEDKNKAQIAKLAKDYEQASLQLDLLKAEVETKKTKLLESFVKFGILKISVGDSNITYIAEQAEGTKSYDAKLVDQLIEETGVNKEDYMKTAAPRQATIMRKQMSRKDRLAR